jgi:glycosyltransferase involved in cell wall biosynthesis
VAEIVSIVIPTFNHSRFLKAAIESALTQTSVDPDVIVVDDGSTDETDGLVRRFQSVRYVHQENRGLPAARNVGLRSAEGRYVIFLDADDRLLPGAGRTGVEQIQRHESAAFVSGEHRYIDLEGRVTAEWSRTPWSEGHYDQFLRNNYVGMVATVLFDRRAVLEASGFDERLPACEDYDLYLRISRTRKVAMHGQLVAEYRRYGAAMSDDSARMLRAAVTVLKRQQTTAGQSPASGFALAEGLRHWRRYYGQPLAARARLRLKEGNWRGCARDVSVLARYAPGYLPSIISGG